MGTVEVFLSIKIEVDDEFSFAEHVDDIVQVARKVFPTAEIAAVEPELTTGASKGGGPDHPFG